MMQLSNITYLKWSEQNGHSGLIILKETANYQYASRITRWGITRTHLLQILIVTAVITAT